MQKIEIFKAKAHLPRIIRQIQKGHKRNTFVFNKLKKLLQISPLGSGEEIIKMKEIRRK